MGPEGNGRVGAVRLEEPRRVGGTSVYWWDDVGSAVLRRADEWRLVFRKPDGTWEPVRARDEFGTRLDTANTVEFEPVETTALRIEVKLRPNLGRNPPMASVPGRDRTEAGFALDLGSIRGGPSDPPGPDDAGPRQHRHLACGTSLAAVA